MVYVRTWLGRSVAACTIALLCCLLLVITPVLADSYDTQATSGLGASVFLPMADSSGPMTDVSSGGNNCAWHSALSSAAGGPGTAARHASFVNYSYCQFGAGIALAGAFSLSWWGKGTGLPDNMPIYDGCLSSSDCTSHVRVWADVADKFCVEQGAAGSFAAECSSVGGSFVDGTWHMYALACSAAAACNFYLDGAADGSQTGGVVFPSMTSTNGLVGARWVNGDYLAADVSRWGLWAGVQLSGSAIATLYSYSSGSPVTSLNITPFVMYATQGGTATWLANGSGGPDTVTSWSSIPGGVLSGCTNPLGSITCTIGAQGSYLVTFGDSSGNHSLVTMIVTGPGARFALASNGSGVPLGTTFQVWGIAFDAAGNNVSQGDSWTLTAPAGSSCSASFYVTSTGVTYDCHLTAAGSVTFSGADQYGFTSRITVTEAAAPASGGTSPTCGTVSIAGTTWPDLGCWFHVLVDQVVALPVHIAQQMYDFLFISSTGRSSVDFAGVLSSFMPSVGCRAGQAPTHPDGVHCLPFPLSAPFDAYNIAAFVFGVAPAAPSIPFTIHAGPMIWTGSVSPAFMLSDSVMQKIRAVEYVIFLVALGWATGEALKLFGVGA